MTKLAEKACPLVRKIFLYWNKVHRFYLFYLKIIASVSLPIGNATSKEADFLGWSSTLWAKDEDFFVFSVYTDFSYFIEQISSNQKRW